MAALRKIENKYVKDPADGNEVYATNVVKELTEAEARNLNSFESLIDHNILSSREYQSGDYERNGYYTIKLFAPIFFCSPAVRKARQGTLWDAGCLRTSGCQRL